MFPAKFRGQIFDFGIHTKVVGSMVTDITMFQAITLAIAATGAVLGTINTWQSLDKSRVRLLVRPKHAIPIGGMNPSLTFCIEVINLSSFAVTINDVGILYKGSNQRGSIAKPILMDDGEWPRRLEPRSSVTVYSQNPTALAGTTIKCAYASTQCGYRETGSTPALKQIAERRS